MLRTLRGSALAATLALASAANHTAAAPLSAAPVQDTSALMRHLRALAAETGGTVGVHALHLQSGQRVSLRGAEPFFMSSVTKFPLAVHVLREVERGRITLGDTVAIPAAQMSPGRSPIRDGAPRGARATVEQLLHAAVSESDNSANDALQRLTGGPAAITRTLESLDIRGIRVDRPYTRLAVDLKSRVSPGDRRDTATPEAMAALLAALQQGRVLNRANTARLIGWMTDTQNPATRLVAGVPAGTAVAHKTGTWNGLNGSGIHAINDVGIVTLPNGRGHLAIAIFVRDTPRGMRAVDPVMARIPRALFEHWTARR